MSRRRLAHAADSSARGSSEPGSSTGMRRYGTGKAATAPPPIAVKRQTVSTEWEFSVHGFRPDNTGTAFLPPSPT